MYLCVCIYVCVCVYCVFMYVCVYLSMFVCMCVCMYVCMCICMVCMCMCVYMYIYIHIYIYTYIYIYRVIEEESAILWEMIVCVILSKKVHTNMGSILNGYRDMVKRRCGPSCEHEQQLRNK